jgi:hypothetical protein
VSSPEPDATADAHALTPARATRVRDRRPAGSAEYDDADLQRGLAAAVLGSLGRLQLRLDAMAREQTESLTELRSAIADIDRRLGAIEAVARTPAAKHGAAPGQ